MHGDLADFWTDSAAQRNKAALVALRREQLLAEIELRLGDQTLSDAHIHLLRTCLELPSTGSASICLKRFAHRSIG